VSDRLGLRDRIAALTDTLRLQFAPETNLFTEEDQLDDSFGSNRGGSRFLGRFSVDDITSLIASSRVGSELRRHGIDDWYFASAEYQAIAEETKAQCGQFAINWDQEESCCNLAAREFRSN
jgi:hypothetical protein